MSKVFSVSFKSYNDTFKFQQILFDNGITWSNHSKDFFDIGGFFIAINDKRLYTSQIFDNISVQGSFIKNNKLNRKLYPEGVQFSNYLLVKQ